MGIHTGAVSFFTASNDAAMVKKGAEMAEERTPLDNIMIPENTGLGRAWAKLRADLNAMKAERDRWKKEALNLRAKVTALEEAAEASIDEEEREEYEKDDGGRYRAENDFDARDHYREM